MIIFDGEGTLPPTQLIIDDDDDEHLDRDFSGLDICLTSEMLSMGSSETVSWLKWTIFSFFH